MKQKSPAFQWYPKDILASARVAIMSLEEEGAYRRALDFCWISGSLPADPAQLARVIGKGCSIEVATVVRDMFIVDQKNPQVLIHERLEIERKHQMEWRKKSADGGIKSGLVRRKRANSTSSALKDGSGLVEPNAKRSGSSLVEPNTNSSSASSSPSACTEKEESLRDSGDAPPEPKPEAKAGGADAAAVSGAMVSRVPNPELDLYRQRDELLAYLAEKQGGGAIPARSANRAAALWLVKHSGFSLTDCQRCLDELWEQPWRNKVDWLTVKGEIAQFFSRKEITEHGEESKTTRRLRAIQERWEREDEENRANCNQITAGGKSAPT